MLTDPKLKSQVDTLWDRFWSGGLTNPMDAIEQMSFLLFLKRLDDLENAKERQAQRRGAAYTSPIPAEMRWSQWSNMKADAALAHVRDTVFPWLRTYGASGSSFERYMQNAEFKIAKGSLLIEATKLIDQMQIAAQNQDVQGDLYEYMLSKLSVAGRNGQFRTPRHIIRMLVKMVDPQPGERIGDLAAGTCGFLVNAYQHILEGATPPESLSYDAEGHPHNLDGSKLTKEQRDRLQEDTFYGFDNDSGMAMLRIGSMNLMLHGIAQPRFFYMDTLSKAFTETRRYQVILMNPPFKGAIDKDDVSDTLPATTTKTELLFLHLILRALDMGGRCAVIVPDGVLFGSSRAHLELRRRLVEDNRLDGVVSMPSGVFKPYAGVSTAALLFTRGGTTERVWFYDMAHDGFSLDDKRDPTPDQNDIPDALDAWARRGDAGYEADRQARLADLRAQVTPLKARRLQLQADSHRLQFEAAIAPDGAAEAHARLDEARQALARLEAELRPLQASLDQASRQFWVTRAQIKANKYDLTASRYRTLDQDEAYYEAPQVTLGRMRTLEEVMLQEMRELDALLS